MALVAAAAVWLLSSAFTLVLLTPVIPHEDELHFKEWMLQHNKVYGGEEFFQRLQIFRENKKRVERHNAGNHSYTLGLNGFADMTFGEFKKSFLMSEPQNCSATKGQHISTDGPYPKSVDWREKGNFVTPVKYQGHCGSCWTFSTTGCLESVNAIATGKLISLSEQQLVDCAQDFNNKGCNGGLPSQAFEYIKYNGGIMTEEDYPYKARDDFCQYDPARAAVSLHDVVNITSCDEEGMVDAVARLNPVTFGFDVVRDFLLYKEGVYSSDYCKNTPDRVNHAVLAVGYGVDENGTPYWIVKNSWGEHWGNKGYFWIERGSNMCGLATCSSYPLPSV